MRQHPQGTSLEIEITGYDMTTRELKSIVEKNVDIDKYAIDLTTKPNLSDYRSIDPTVLVAVIGGTGAALAALISGLLKISATRMSQKIVIQSKTGSKLEVPVGVSAEKLDELIGKLRDMDSPRVYRIYL